eukprot:gnl/TRDRNA2_/TRDRNA2_178059_c0_seq1.p3 gnl/TRDRNA2_/TRDRNA2_178059_c0~~gnl/TRDRNA2_/TRDRNA2_178059_c0_seq1.p3  ORF type:complete len:295 (-),score=-16.94 gnl/TRDRNA2_/TRDRNA2_178059_c0_seq1:1033-1917(-)
MNNSFTCMIYFIDIKFNHNLILTNLKSKPRFISKSKTTVKKKFDSTSYFSAHSIKCADVAKSIVTLSKKGILTINQEKQPPVAALVEYYCEKKETMFVKVTEKSYSLNPSPLGSECSLLVRSWPIGDITIFGKLTHTEKEPQKFSSSKDRSNYKSSRLFRKDLVRVYRITIDNCLLSFNYDINDKNKLISADDLVKAQSTDMTRYIRRFIAQVNEKLWKDVNSIASDALGIKNISNAELLWIDRVGVYIVLSRPKNHLLRVPFLRYVRDERDLCSQFTMLSQVSWDRQTKIKNS